MCCIRTVQLITGRFFLHNQYLYYNLKYPYLTSLYYKLFII